MPVDQSRVQEALSERYRIEHEIGRGGMATVYLAEDLKHHRRVAIKILDPDLSQALGAQRFLREIETVANLSHPHILPLHDSGEADGLLYFVMPFARGESLRVRLDREKVLPIDEALRITHEIADALAYAHREGVVHRDVKPENILLEADHAVLTDFGLAGAAAAAGSEDTRLTQPGVSLGTPGYMSPEQAAGDHRLDGRSDQYSLACVLHEMLAGEPLYSGSTPRQIIAKQIQEPPIEVRTIRPSVPEGVQSAMLRALAKPAADRFHSIHDFSHALERPPSEPTPGPRPRWLRRAREELSRLALATVIILGIWFVIRPGAPELDDSLIVCFPLASRGGEEFQGQDVALTISRTLEGTGVLSCLDGWQYLNEGQRRDIVSLTENQARRLARDRGAGRFLLGSVALGDDSITVTLALHDTRDGSLIDQSSYVEHRALASAGQVGVSAFSKFFSTLLHPGRPLPSLSHIGQREQAAVALWTEGERHYRSLRFDTAFVLLQEAVRIDSLLIPAALRGALAASWAHHGVQTDTLIALAVRHDTLLTPEEAHLAHGLAAHWAGDADAAIERFQDALDLRPDWPEAWTALGETRFHLLPRETEGYHLAEEAFRESVRLDPDFGPPLIHLTEIEVWNGDFGAAEALLNRIKQPGADSTNILRLELLLSCARDSVPAIPWEEAVRTDPLAAFGAAMKLATGARYPACAEDGLRAVLADPPDRPGVSYSWGSLMGLGGLLVALGRGEEAAELWHQAEVSGEAGAVPFLYLLSGTVDESVSRHAARIDTLARRLFGPEYENLRPIEGWSLGVWHASQGHVEDLQLLAGRMKALADQDSASPLVLLLHTALQGHLAVAQGDTASAIDLFLSLNPTYPSSDLSYGIWQVLPYERIRLAELLLEEDRLLEALEVAYLFDHPEPVATLPFLPRSLAVRARAAEAMGWDQQAEEFAKRLEELGRSSLLAAPGETFP